MCEALSWKGGGEGRVTKRHGRYSREKGSQLRGSFFCEQWLFTSMQENSSRLNLRAEKLWKESRAQKRGLISPFKFYYNWKSFWRRKLLKSWPFRLKHNFFWGRPNLLGGSEMPFTENKRRLSFLNIGKKEPCSPLVEGLCYKCPSQRDLGREVGFPWEGSGWSFLDWGGS